MGHGIGANRGALPYHKLSNRSGCVRVLVPLAHSESLWIGWMLEEEIKVTGTDLDNESVRQIEVAKSREWRLVAAESVDSKDGPHPIDADFYVLAAEQDQLERAHLVFRLIRDQVDASECLEIVLATEALYSLLSGLPPPRTTSSDQAYGGWRLP